MGALKTGFQIWNGLAPEGGPVCMPVDFDFSSVANQQVDLFLEEANKQIDFVQSVYIDNADNAAAFTLTVSGTGQRIRVKANTQGWYPLLSGDQTRVNVSSTVAAVKVTVIFCNVPMPTAQWATV